MTTTGLARLWRRLLGPALAGLLCGLAGPTPAQAQPEIATANVAQYVGDGVWDWTVFIDPRSALLDQVACVEYTLHPTFPNPVVRRCTTRDPAYPFGLRATGWGTFVIGVDVELADGRVIPLRHQLVFEAPRASETVAIRADNTAERIPNSKYWTWTVFIEAPPEVLDDIRCVEYTLHPTFPNPVREVCDRGRDAQAFALSTSGWGTFVIDIRVFFRDGSVRDLSHQLRFR